MLRYLGQAADLGGAGRTNEGCLLRQFVLRRCEQRARALFLMNEAMVVVILKSLGPECTVSLDSVCATAALLL